ncbi:MAG TPA: ABC transporter ATP-binding protein [Cyclobacteriaceae bacterium]|nr:ABC transporter ATP-binding protein [Cyclobacteriaceae bacterium]HMV08949.1 ABC transporter ATP-binding protein [Cyclobacteriaceae bacterium]HMV90144.1 ABC transporter ATP-binding protein [Cyclobacteriaceae bacterium]HMX00296.1 ABC transporter ATP-binding protein [Cyclobacteriaceae bacterium]HMX49705.1 ABC transporter ATP-binding protein [Cyclobacteriaceae bacterium]
MVKASGIRKSYGSLNVLKGIEMEVKKGEVISIVGASGAGKSTLLHILGTLDTPDTGTLSIGNETISSKSSKALASFRNHSIGFVFQFHNLLPEFTALENVMIPGLIARKSETDVKKKAVSVMELLGIAHRLDHKPSELSGGEQQRTAVARALINDPALVLADEPSGNLDSKNAQELHQLFFDLRKQLNQTFIIVTHNQQFAGMADRRLEIKDGVII